MRLVEGTLRLSASDLMRFKVCRHATALDLRKAEIGDIIPGADSEEAELLQRQGDAHEAAYLQSLRDKGLTIVEIPKDAISLEQSAAMTIEALHKGADVIFQGAFLSGAWGGYSDFLERVDRPSALGDWSYEVIDTKLKRSPDPKHVLQLALYSDLLAEIQGRPPDQAHLQLGDGSRYSIRLRDVAAYCRHARAKFEAFLDERPLTRPEPVSGCGLCPWRERCQAEWEAADSLVLVAGISRSQREKIEAAGIATMTALGAHADRVPRLAPETQRKLQVQARLQAARRAGGPPSFELRAAEPGRGFDLLPEPDDGDVFYDIEGDPYHPGGLEYLHGLWLHEGGAWTFQPYWAHDRAAEGEAVARLLGFLSARMRAFPRAHIYHYANYEIAALRRLTAAHSTSELALDQLLREQRFVDLFKVVSGGLIASEAGYSIKDLEAFYMAKREGDVATAGASVVVYEKWRQSGDPDLLGQIEAYNRTDCISTQLLRDWLVAKARPSTLPWPILGEDHRPTGATRLSDEEAEMAARHAQFAPARARLGDAVGDLLFQLNYFHAREDKPYYWGIFDRLAQESEALLDDLECIAGLEAIGAAVPDKQSTERQYRFPPQETKMRAGPRQRPCIKPAGKPESVGLVALDMEACILTLRRGKKAGELPDRLDLLPSQPLPTTKIREAIMAVSDGIIADNGAHRAVEHLLLRTPPTFTGGPRPLGIVDADADLVLETSKAIAAMDGTVLPIQGPPGTGKTYVSAWSIMDLVRAGKRVAVASHSHKAIDNLLKAVADRATELGDQPMIVHKGGEEDEGGATSHPLIGIIDDNEAPEIGMADVVGGTVFLFARIAEPIFDYLFVDEAGQVSLANLVAMSRIARNIVLVGDPMQLPQPTQASHPGQSGQSALEYLIGDHRVVPADRGIFMPVSRRMHCGVCGFISAAVYEDQLTNDALARGQRLDGADGTSLLGARLNATPHAGRSQICPEEIAAIQAFLDMLLGAAYLDRKGRTRAIGRGDILVVAPYNAQVNALRSALPGVRVGTVDKFQGQEAPICLVSMTTSSAEEMPRDLDFLFSLNRINVALSRAQAMAAVFASPLLLEVPCRTVDDMMLVNTLCRLHEHGGG